MPTVWRDNLWTAVLGLGLVCVGLHAMLGTAAQTVLYYGAATGCLGATVAALWLRRPAYRAPWYVFIAGFATLVVADIIWQYYDFFFGIEAPYPSYADALYVGGFVLVIAAFRLWSRHAHLASDREDSLDAGIIALGAAVAVWMVIVGPRLGTPDIGLPAQILSVTYPILDLFLLLLLVRIAMRRDLRSYQAPLLFGIGTLAFGVSDVLWGWGELTSNYATVEIIADSGWMLCYVFWGAAALNPHVLELERRLEPRPRSGAYLSTRRAALLVGVALMVPVGLILEQGSNFSIDTLIIAAGSAGLFTLVVSRLQLIVRSLEAAMRKQTELQQDLEYAAFHDPLTGLANRTLLNASLGHVVAQRREQAMALLFLDLDNFKEVNDRLGHAAGDRLLVHVAERLRKCIRPQDMIGRLGGDEFVILLRFEGESPLEASIAVSNRILEELEQLTSIDGEEIHIGASIGIAWLGDDHVSVDSILRAADRAMYDAKRAGKNRYSVATVVSEVIHLEDEVRPDDVDGRLLDFGASRAPAPQAKLSDIA